MDVITSGLMSGIHVVYGLVEYKEWQYGGEEVDCGQSAGQA